MKFRVYVLSLLALAMAIWLLFHLACIWVYGRFFIHESNTLILLLETIAILFTVAFSISCVLEQLKVKKINQNGFNRMSIVHNATKEYPN
jgi:hypothetical protein